MGAAEDKRVNPAIRQWFKLAPDGSVSQFIFEPTFLNQRYQQRAGEAAHAQTDIKFAQRFLVCATLDCSAGANHANMTVARDSARRPGAGLDHPNDRNRKGFL